MTEEDRFERAIEKLMADQSPRQEAAKLGDEDREMLRMAQLMRGSQQAEPRPEFVEELHSRLFPAEHRVSRRAAFFSGIGTLAAGILGGIGIDHVINSENGSGGEQAFTSTWKNDLVREGKGRWIPVAHKSEVPVGAVLPFAAGSVQGFLINDGVRIHALSRICTHMGCALTFEKNKQRFLCPCHGAEFTLKGKMAHYPVPLKNLPKIYVREQGDIVEAYGV